ncbi:ATP-binding cassette domain-containing protein [Planococcus glaciei]|nr:hypothetical protein [Planococcus glaciei]QDY45168.1 ATP-binding cassette domain-containing protein [Planococcus glaciei]
MKKASEGEVQVENEAITSIKTARRKKIAMVTQEPSLVDELSIAENVIVNESGKWFVNWKEKREKNVLLSKQVGTRLGCETESREIVTGSAAIGIHRESFGNRAHDSAFG